MKTVIRRIALTLLMVGGVSGTHAAGGLYLGPSVGIMDPNVGGFDEAINAGFLLGYDFFNLEQFHVSAETEFTTTISDGDVKFGSQKGDWDIDTRGVFVAARVGDTFYIKVRYGVVWSDLSVKIAGNSTSNSDSSGSWGGALGWNFGEHWAVQADGTLVDPDVTYWNLGVNYRF